MTAHFSSSSEVFATTPEIAYDTLVDAPLEAIFSSRSGPIPAIERTEPVTGVWGEVGAARRIRLADGTSNLETMVGADRAALDYRYQLSEFTGPFALLISGVDGRFAMQPDGSGTRVTWSWALHPKNPVAGLALPVVGIFWRAWARAMWPRLGDRLPT